MWPVLSVLPSSGRILPFIWFLYSFHVYDIFYWYRHRNCSKMYNVASIKSITLWTNNFHRLFLTHQISRWGATYCSGLLMLALKLKMWGSEMQTLFRYVQVLMFVSQWKTLWTPASVILLYIPYSMQMYKGMLGSIRSKQDLPSTYLEYLILSEICSTQNLSAAAWCSAQFNV